MSMNLICYDGADFTGKTTSCVSRSNEILADNPRAQIVMVHFPIRNLGTDIKMINTSLQPEIFRLCAKFSHESMIKIQDIIADNIEANSWILLELAKQGFHVIIDRFIYSNIVYRRMYCNQTIVLDEFMRKYEYASKVIKRAKINILTEPIEELIARKNLRYSTNRPEDGTIDMINEENENINRANEEFKKFIC